MLLHFILLVKTKFMDVNIHLKHKQYFSMVGFSHYNQQWRFHFTDKNSNHGWEVSLLCNTLPCILQQCWMLVTERESDRQTETASGFNMTMLLTFWLSYFSNH